jgi:3-oxoacyl-[acyl-carrier protein] reductase
MGKNTQLAGDSALVTGSTGGIGREVAVELARRGADVVVNGRSVGGQDVIDDIEALGQRAHFEQGDITEFDDMKRVVDGAVAALGPLDILVGSGGVASAPVPNFFQDQSVSELREQFETHYMGRLHLIKAALEHLANNGGGRIVNISADAGRFPTPGEVGVGGATGGLLMANRVLATELARLDIIVNTVSISVVEDTPGIERVLKESDAASVFEKALEQQDFAVSMIDVAETIAFLAGDRPITGQVLSVNGGIAV